MEHRKFWNILIVDDEPDVHSVSDLSLKREKVFGAPLKIFHANSAKEARAFFTDQEAGLACAVALIDVVMETDDAGLELCRWIREEMHNDVTQLVLRTGQPGKAPPRQVIDDYNISGYLHKVEATGERLYMVIKAAIQQYYNLQYLFWSSALYDEAREFFDDVQSLFVGYKSSLAQELPVPLGIEYHRGIDFFGERYVGQGRFANKAEFDKVRHDLLQRGADQVARGGIAAVDGNVLVQTKVISTGKIATMVVGGATVPRGLHHLYGSVWRQNLSYLAEVFSGL